MIKSFVSFIAIWLLTGTLAAQGGQAEISSAASTGNITVNWLMGTDTSIEFVLFEFDAGGTVNINETVTTSQGVNTYTVEVPAVATKVRLVYKPRPSNGGNPVNSTWITITVPPGE